MSDRGVIEIGEQKAPTHSNEATESGRFDQLADAEKDRRSVLLDPDNSGQKTHEELMKVRKKVSDQTESTTDKAPTHEHHEASIFAETISFIQQFGDTQPEVTPQDQEKAAQMFNAYIDDVMSHYADHITDTGISNSLHFELPLGEEESVSISIQVMKDSNRKYIFVQHKEGIFGKEAFDYKIDADRAVIRHDIGGAYEKNKKREQKERDIKGKSPDEAIRTLNNNLHGALEGKENAALERKMGTNNCPVKPDEIQGLIALINNASISHQNLDEELAISQPAGVAMEVAKEAIAPLSTVFTKIKEAIRGVNYTELAKLYYTQEGLLQLVKEAEVEAKKIKQREQRPEKDSPSESNSPDASDTTDTDIYALNEEEMQLEMDLEANETRFAELIEKENNGRELTSDEVRELIQIWKDRGMIEEGLESTQHNQSLYKDKMAKKKIDGLFERLLKKGWKSLNSRNPYNTPLMKLKNIAEIKARDLGVAEFSIPKGTPPSEIAGIISELQSKNYVFAA